MNKKSNNASFRAVSTTRTQQVSNDARDCERRINSIASYAAEPDVDRYPPVLKIRLVPPSDRVRTIKHRSVAEQQLHTPKLVRTAAIPTRVVVAEDDDEMRWLLKAALELRGYEVITCPDGVALLRQLDTYFSFSEENANGDVDLVISDIRMPGLTGLEILQAGSDLDDFPPFILITAFGATSTHEEAKLLGARACFDKPFDIDELVATVLLFVPPRH